MATVRLKDVAAAAGVSVATASRALTGRGRLSVATVEKVSRVAERMGYRVNEVGRALREGSIRTVGVVVPVISNPFFGQIVQSLEAELEGHGFEMLVADSHGEVDREARRLQMLVARDVEGLIVIPADAERSAPALQRIDVDTPLVQLDRQVNGLASDFVGVDNQVGMDLVIDHLASCGVRSVVLVGSDRTTSVGQERRAAFDAAASRAGLTVRKPILDRFTLEFGERAGRLLAGRRSRPDAAVAGDDLIAIGLVRGLAAHGIRVPADVKVTGFDGTVMSEISSPTLTTVRQPYAALTHEAVDLLLTRAADRSRPIEHRRLPPALVVGQSTSAAGIAADTPQASIRTASATRDQK
jgi:LacI family transcriptional regulator